MDKANGRKTTFITGAASGIGAETAKYFAKQGWFVGLYDIDEAGLSRVAEEIGADNCISGNLDVRDRENWNTSVAQFAEATGNQMHVFFNNAGIGNHGWFEDISPEDSDKVIDVNFKGVVNGVYACLPVLKATDKARIINTASAAGMYGSPQLAVYSATKFAVRGLSEALDAELRPLGVSVTCLMPWFVDTPILHMTDSEGSNRDMKQDIQATGTSIYPVSDVVEKVWAAVESDELYQIVGKDAKRANFFARHIPSMIRKRMHKATSQRET